MNRARKWWIAVAGGLALAGPGDRGPGHGRGGFADPQKLATFLGITADQLRTETGASGATLATVAQAHGKSRDELKAFLTTEMKSRVDQEVANGELTQAQADTKLADMTSKLDQMIDGTGHPGHGPDDGMRGFRGLPPVAPDASPSPAASNNG